MNHMKEGIDYDSHNGWIILGKRNYQFFCNYDSCPKEGIEVDFDDPDFSHDKYFDSFVFARIKEESGNRYSINYQYDEHAKTLQYTKCVYLTPLKIDKSEGERFYQLHKEQVDYVTKEFLWGE